MAAKTDLSLHGAPGHDHVLEEPVELPVELKPAPAPASGSVSSNAAAKPRVCVGAVAGAHGVRGAVRLKSFTAIPESIAQYGPLEDESGRRHFAVKLIGAAKGVVIAQLSGVEDRNQAEALRGCRLYLPRAVLPPTEEDEYYHADLIGLAAVLGDGTPLGHVRAVHDFGAGDTLEIERPAGPPAMVPFTRQIVPEVDLAQGRLVVDPPPGLLEPVAEEPDAEEPGLEQNQ